MRPRRHLVRAAVTDDYGALETVMTEAAQSAAEPVARMRAIGMAFCRFAEENPGSYRLIIVVVQPVPASGPRAEGHPAARVQNILQRAIADCQAAGLAADVDPEVLRPACGAGGTASSSCVSPSPSVSGPQAGAIVDQLVARLIGERRKPSDDVRSAGAEQQLVGWRVRAPGTTRNTPRAKF
ncbi:MAG: TetR-like C-terminal domain-containing protein [Candidatus Dormibacteraceae bacterium]